MKSISNLLLPMLLGIATLSTSFAGSDDAVVVGRGIPTRDLVPSCEKHYLDRTGTQVFRWDPIGAAPRPTTVLCYEVDGSREFQRVPLHLGIGDVAFISACGRWKFGANGPYYKFGPGGDGTIPVTTLAGRHEPTGSLLMDVKYGPYRDHFVFEGDGAPIAIHGPCESVTFIAHDQVATRGVAWLGYLHVKVEILDPVLVASEGKGYVK